VAVASAIYTTRGDWARKGLTARARRPGKTIAGATGHGARAVALAPGFPRLGARGFIDPCR